MATALNPMDINHRNGEAKMVTGRRFPSAMGYDWVCQELCVSESA
ncbi:hypothetical protein [Nocardioides marmoraquaticus]